MLTPIGMLPTQISWPCFDSLPSMDLARHFDRYVAFHTSPAGSVMFSATTAHADGAAAYVGELGTIVDNYTAKRMDKLSYRIPLACVYIVPCIIAVGLVFIPESPRWLAGKGRMDEARKALKWLRPESQNTDKEFSEIMIAIDEERELARNTAVWDMFRHPVDRRRTMLAVGGVSVQAASGAMYMIGTYFSSHLKLCR